MVLIVLAVAGLSACTDRMKSVTFEATVLEVNEGGLVVQPAEDAAEGRSADKISVGLSGVKLTDAAGADITAGDFAPGDLVSVTYSGGIRESYPSQVTASKVVLTRQG